MASSKRRRKKNRPRDKEGSHRLTSDLINGIGGPPRMSEPNPRDDECFGGASNLRVTAGGSPTGRGRGGKVKGLIRGDTAHLKWQNDTQQSMQQNGKYMD